MKNDIVIIIPYFGKLPNYFQLWLNSCSYNHKIDWLLFIDDETDYNYPSNVYVHRMTFAAFNQLIHEVLGDGYVVRFPYKICDYKPAFGLLFEKYICDYRYWGYGDIDVIYGDLRKFLPNNYRDYDRLFELGHFSLVKNDQSINNLFRHNFSSKVLSANVHFSYDELFFNIVSIKKLKFYRAEPFADIDYHKEKFSLIHTSINEKGRLLSKSDNYALVFEFKSGKLYGIFKRNNTWDKKEFAYIHMQKRNMRVIDGLMNEHFMIVPNNFININSYDLERYFMQKKSINMSNYIKAKIAAVKRRWICPEYFKFINGELD